MNSRVQDYISTASPQLFEKTAVISKRARQLLENQAQPLISIEPGVYMSVVDIATQEYERGMLDLAIVREYPDGTIKTLNLNQA